MKLQEISVCLCFYIICKYRGGFFLKPMRQSARDPLPADFAVPKLWRVIYEEGKQVSIRKHFMGESQKNVILAIVISFLNLNIYLFVYLSYQFSIVVLFLLKGPT